MSLRTPTRHTIPINPDPKLGGIPLAYITQEKNNWCWAACVEMVLKHFRVSKDPQCAIAQKGLAFANPGTSLICCTGDSGADLCDQTLEKGPITQLWTEGYRLDLRYRNVRGSSDAVKARLIQEYLQSLREGHPVEFGYRRGAGHVLILYGWEGDPNSGQFSFCLFDPDPNAQGKVTMPADRIFNGEYGRLAVTWEIITS